MSPARPGPGMRVLHLHKPGVYMCFTPDARGTEYSNSVPVGTEFQNDLITSAKHEGHISVWARVRSTRVPNIIHHEGRGCNAD